MITARRMRTRRRPFSWRRPSAGACPLQPVDIVRDAGGLASPSAVFQARLRTDIAPRPVHCERLRSLRINPSVKNQFRLALPSRRWYFQECPVASKRGVISIPKKIGVHKNHRGAANGDLDSIT